MWHYGVAFVSACLQHKTSWWVSLFTAYIFGYGFVENYSKARPRLMRWLNMSHPEEISAWWLVVPFLVWVIASFAHRDTMRKLYAGRIKFEAPEIVYDVPLYEHPRGVTLSAGSQPSKLVGHNDIASVQVCNVPYDSAHGEAIERAFGTITIFKSNWQRIRAFDYPRWANNPKPGYEGNPSDHFPDEWNFRTIHPNGSKNRMDLFIKQKGDALAYGFRGYSQLQPLWQDTELSLPAGRYNVLIRIKGNPMNYASGLWVELENPGMNAALRINRLPFSVAGYWRRRS